MKRTTTKKKAAPRKKAAPKKPAAAKKSSATYEPKPLQTTGWAPFRYRPPQ
jgi:hypothetical protein